MEVSVELIMYEGDFVAVQSPKKKTKEENGRTSYCSAGTLHNEEETKRKTHPEPPGTPKKVKNRDGKLSLRNRKYVHTKHTPNIDIPVAIAFTHTSNCPRKDHFQQQNLTAYQL